MEYSEYLEVMKDKIKGSVAEQLINLADTDCVFDVLEDTLSQYRMLMEDRVLALYHTVGLYPESYQLESMVPRIKDNDVKERVQRIFFELDILHEAIRDYIEVFDKFEREPVSIDEMIEQIPIEKRDAVVKLIKKYSSHYGEEPIYIGQGQSCVVFGIGDKVIKFGSMRNYSAIPYCLNIYEQISYDKYKSVYVTDKVQTFEVSEEICQKMYNLLRAKGFVWVDVKPDNIGILNGQLKILDDVDIVSMEDALKTGKSSILDYLTFSMKESLLELNWLKSVVPNFDISLVDRLFDNKSLQTLDHIDRLKYEFMKLNADYTFDPNYDYYQLFCEMLLDNINENNKIVNLESEKVVNSK